MSAGPMTRWIELFRGPRAGPEGDTINLRYWFSFFVAWMAVLAAVGLWSYQRVESGATTSLALWLTAIGLFYLSLCCLFCPLPTAWVVMLLASNDVALTASVPVRVILVAGLCAAASTMANLNEYHVLTFAFRYRTVGRLRESRFYRRAADWFGVSPFWTIALFSFIPIPVDIIRLLAVAGRYSRTRFAEAYFLGRLIRYGVLAVSAAGLDLSLWEITLIQAALVVVAALKVVHGMVRRKNRCVTPSCSP